MKQRAPKNLSLRVVGATLTGVVTTLIASLAAAADGGEEQPLPPSVRCLTFSPDSRSLAAVGSEGLTRGVLAVWDCETRVSRLTLREEAGYPSVAFSPDGRRIALGRFAPESRLLDAQTGEVLQEFSGHTDHARCVAFTPDGKQLVTGSYDRTVKVWDVENAKVEMTLEGHTQPVYSVGVSPDGNLLAAAEAKAYAVRLWDLKSGKELRTFEKLGSLVPQVGFSPDGRLLAVSSWAGHLSLYDTQTWEPWIRLRGIGGVRWSAFSPDGRHLAAAGHGPGLYVFDIDRTAEQETTANVASLLDRFHDDAYQVREAASRELAEIGMAAAPQLREAMHADSAEVRWRSRRLLERLADAASARKLEGHAAQVECVAFSPDGRWLASGDADGAVRLWSARDWKLLATLSLADAEAPSEKP